DVAADVGAGESLAVFGDATELDGLVALVCGDLLDPEVLGRVRLLITVQGCLGGRVGSAGGQADCEGRSECCGGDAPGATKGTGRRGHAGNRTRVSYGCSGTVLCAQARLRPRRGRFRMPPALRNRPRARRRRRARSWSRWTVCSAGCG